MAEKKDDIEIQPAQNKKKRLILLLAVGVLVALIVGGLAFWLLAGDQATSDETAVAETQKADPIYHAVTDPFIVNFAKQSNNAVRFLQIKMKIMARNQQAISDFKTHEPAIVHELLLLFFSQNYDDLNTSEGTRALQTETLQVVNQQLANLAGNQDGIEAVYFTSLVMQ
ncbi:Flagellar biosynthesis protein FliL [Methylophaga frappieri]|uniref:Flagellar protein FliL n=1 Tax=Methylophaga frappieri (strain ATCC BAA-2434 / DSM 25690 / JAM7) TaxID=754477 RepID=I1YHL0_METFJ|nr:flagellar basal body-associated FliL family protein [Methylophaga frappieri]AFJ02403.1 Flagellar biosynthesis protein FliL [Methylophaga frappieri]